MIRGERQKRTDRLFEGWASRSRATELPVMTQRHLGAAQEGDRSGSSASCGPPSRRAIQKARELGDLSENAEYHSAKLKQANVSQLVAALQLRLARARFVDDAEYRDGVVGLGTEVVLESDDQELRPTGSSARTSTTTGENVISFQTPVGPRADGPRDRRRGGVG